MPTFQKAVEQVSHHLGKLSYVGGRRVRVSNCQQLPPRREAGRFPSRKQPWLRISISCFSCFVAFCYSCLVSSSVWICISSDAQVSRLCPESWANDTDHIWHLPTFWAFWLAVEIGHARMTGFLGMQDSDLEATLVLSELEAILIGSL